MLMSVAGDYPTFSIIVPVMNVVHTIRDLLDSLLHLDYEADKLEIIIVDGNSRDVTQEIINEYPYRLVQQEGKGLNAARNTGIKNSTGDIIAYTDGDCVVPPGWAKAIADNFKDEWVSFVGGTLEGYDPTNPLSAYMDETFFHVTPEYKFRVETNTLRMLQLPAGANMAFRRSSLARIKFFDENIYYGFDDLQPVEELSFKGFKIVLDPEVQVWHQHRSTLPSLLKQHFNYGRGGTLLVVHKRHSQLAQWFAQFLLATTFSISIFILLMILGLRLRHIFPFQLGLGTLLIGMITIMFYYLPLSIRSKKLWKIIAYPLLDMLRGFSFTFGGLYQLAKSLGQKVIQDAQI